VSGDLAKKIRLGLGELATVREQLTPLMSLPDASAGVIERAAACAMLHSFYTDPEADRSRVGRASAFLGRVAQGTVELKQMSIATATRRAVLSSSLAL